jgi:hypothetical protein
MALEAADLKTIEAYKKASKRDATKITETGKTKFWLYKDITLPSASGKAQKLRVLLALLNINEIKVEKPLQGKKPICRGTCNLLDGKVAFEAEEGVIPYARLKTALPLFIGKLLHVPPGVTVEDDGEVDGEDGAPQTGTTTVPQAPPVSTGKAPSTAPKSVSATDLQAAMNKLAPTIKSVVEANPAKKKDIHDLVAAFAEQIKSNKLDSAAGTLAALTRILKGLGGVIGEQADPKKTEFEQKFPALKTRAENAAKSDGTLFGIATPLQTLNAALKEVTDKEGKKDYAGALGLLAGLEGKIKAVEDFVAASNAAHKTVDDEWNAMKLDLDKADEVYPSSPALKAALKKYSDAREGLVTNDDAKNYPAAAKFVEPLKTAVKALLKAAADNDKVEGPKAVAAEKAVKDLVKSKKLAGKTNAEKIKLLKDLRGPSTKMTPEYRAAQREVYKTLKLDPAFVKEDKKKRKEIIKALVPDKAAKAEFKNKRKNWSKQSDDEKIAMIKKAVQAQSKVLGIPAPEIVKVNEPPSGGLITNGYFNPVDGKIYINLHPDSSVNDFEKAIDLAFHENSHNYQNELVKKLENGTLDKNDPAYEQAQLFEINDGPQAYVDGDEDFDVYKKQPLEEHAHLNGPQTAKVFMKAIR